MRPNCECCDVDLPATGTYATICSFECTFCRACAEGVLGGACPNCGGALVTRPTRSAELLAKFPASSDRVVRAVPCGQPPR